MSHISAERQCGARAALEEEISDSLQKCYHPLHTIIIEEIELGRVQRLIIAHQDRLVRFGFEWFAAFCERHGTELVIVSGDSFSPEHEFVQDLLSIMHVFSARLSGLRS